MKECKSVSPRRVVRCDKVSKCQRVRGSKKNHVIMVLIMCMVFCFSLFAFHYSLSYAEGISDIKMSALETPVVKKRWGRDPFVKYEDRFLKEMHPREELPMGLKVEGIITDGKKALAIINGGFYREKEKVDDFLIVDIDKDSIMLEKNGKRFYLGIEKFAIESVQRGGEK